jgi:hypothetical protein
MSRSRKRVGGWSDKEGTIGYKAYYLKLMNTRIRHLDMDEYIGNGNHYRRFINRWDYRDYNWRIFTNEDAGWYSDKPWHPYMK